VMKKLAALTSIDEKLFQELFEVRDLMAGAWNDCDGLEVMPLESPHPVENNVFLIRVRDEESFKSYAHWADIVSFDVLRRILAKSPAKELLGPDYLEKIRKTYLTSATVKKIDAGGGMIHGEPLDFSEDASDKIILAHRATPFSPDQLEVGSNAIFGAVEVLIPSGQDYMRQRAAGYLARTFPGATSAELNSVLRSPIVDFNAGTILLRRDADPTFIYLLLSGSVDRIVPGLGAPLAVASGSLMGAYALTEDGKLRATWRASSPVRAMRIALGAMRVFLRHGGQQERWRTLWSRTNGLRSTRLFGERIGIGDQERISLAMERETLAAGASLMPSKTALCFIHEGELEVTFTPSYKETVGTGGFINEESILGAASTDWTARATRETQIAWIPREALITLPIVIWKLLEAHDRRRCAAALRAGGQK